MITGAHLGMLLLFLCLLVLCSAFFSGSETGMMAVNRYRIRHLAKHNHRGAKRVKQLLDQTDRLLAVILIGNTFANILASSIATVIAVQLWGDLGVLIVTIALTLVILIFAEILPKTVAASIPERYAYVASVPLRFIAILLAPIVWLTNGVVKAILRLFNITLRTKVVDPLSREELRSVVHEARSRLEYEDQTRLLGVLDLDNVTVNHIMVPRSEVIGLDLDDEWDVILRQLTYSQHTRLPVYRGEIDNLEGVVHVRSALNLLAQAKLSKATLLAAAEAPHFIPEGTSLSKQVNNFRKEKCRVGLVVDEYGDLLGLVTLEDILEEIIGKYTTDVATLTKDIFRQQDGSYVVDAAVTVRELNRSLDLRLPEDGPKTLSGLIIEYLEAMPEAGVGVRIAGYPMEILQVKDNKIARVMLLPALKR